jgi:hypothetical protein
MHLIQQLFNHYNEFHAPEISTNRFSPERFNELLISLSEKFRLEKLGESVEGRPINAVYLGNGKKKVILWSQMHGNESTATRAILDILNFFSRSSGFSELENNLLDNLTICILPMLNPDGTARFQRRNALEIDLNRDARAFEATESIILRDLIAEFKPDYAFNLHDQKRFYNIEGTGKPSTIAFLAPAYNIEEETNPSRARAMQLIADLRGQLETIIPGQVGIYDDTYSPRAFGDYTQGSGASTILVESGWERSDMEKEFVRKLNFCFLISAFNSIIEDRHNSYSEDDYKKIPMNHEKYFDVLVRNASISLNDKRAKTDIGIKRSEISIKGSTKFYSVSEITDIGDLKEWYGFDDLDVTDLFIEPGLVYSADKNVEVYLKERRSKAIELLRRGYLYFANSEIPEKEIVELPINVVRTDYKPDLIPKFEDWANFLLKDNSGAIKYLVINGFLWDLKKPLPEDINGVVIR